MKRFPMVEVGIGAALALCLYAAYLGYNVMPVLLIAGVIFLVTQSAGFRNMGSGMGAPRSKVAAAPVGSVPNVKFEDIGGQASAKKELLEAIDFMNNREQIKAMGIRPLKGVLLTGPPGTGKTLLAKAAANHTGSVFLTAAGSEFVEMYAGVGAQRVRDLFKRAREIARKEKKSSAVIFIDEIEVLGAKRGAGNSSHMEYEQTLNQLLVEMDGIVVDDECQVMIMGATNRVDMLDPALMRPGRFDRVVNVDLPDKEGRLAILKLHTKGKPLAEGVVLMEIARQTFGFSGAHLEALTNEAAVLALREGKSQIEPKHFVEAVDKVMLGEKLDRNPTADEKRRVAIHEAGHALVGEWTVPGSVSTITVTPRGRAMGYVRTNPQDDHYLYTKSMLQARIQVALAGFVAEDLIFGEASTGASGDFQQVSNLARHLVAGGLSGLGIIDPEGHDKAAWAAEVQRIIEANQAKVRWFLSHRAAVLEQVADILVAEEVIDGEDLRKLLVDAPELPAMPEAEAVEKEESAA